MLAFLMYSSGLSEIMLLIDAGIHLLTIETLTQWKKKMNLYNRLPLNNTGILINEAERSGISIKTFQRISNYQ
jgi:hypothetical protein